MGALQGSIGLRRYRVMGRPPKNFGEQYLQGVRSHTLVPLEPAKNPHDERAIGWCSQLDEEDLDLQLHKFVFDGRILLSLRVDIIKPPAGQVKRLLSQRLRQAEGKKGSPLSKAAVRDLKALIIAELRQTTPPKTKVTDMVWNLDTQVLYFFSHSKGQNEIFVDLFVQTFGLPVDLEGPGSWAADIAMDGGLEEELLAARPTIELLAGFNGLRPGTKATDEFISLLGV